MTSTMFQRIALVSFFSMACLACGTGTLDVGSGAPPATGEPAPPGAPTAPGAGTSAPPPATKPTDTDPPATKVLLFGGVGGESANVPLDDTWTFDGTQWRQVNAAGPSARSGALAATLHGNVVLFGGYDAASATSLDETWTFDGATWKKLEIPGPHGKSASAMVSIGDRIVLYGGGPEDVSGDTWTFDGSKWTEHAIPGPAARNLTGMAALGDRAVLFGGQLADSCKGTQACPAFMNDTWSFDGTSWTQLSPATAPSGRCFFTIASVDRDELVVYGGRDIHSEINDTWTFDGATWKQVAVSAPTGASGIANAAAGAMLGERAIFFGGAQSVPQGDTFAFGNDKWSLVDLTAHPVRPAPRVGAAMASLP